MARKPLVTACLSAVFAVSLVGAGVTAIASADPGATVLYVSSSGVDSGDCTDQSSPCLSLAYAVAQAPAGAVVMYAASTFLKTVTVSKDLTIEGVGSVGQSSLGVDPATIVTADGTGSMFDVTAGDLTLENMVLQGGSASTIADSSSGTLTVNDMVIQQALLSSSNGGAINNAGGGTVNVTDSVLSDNSAVQGGAIYNASGTTNVTDSELGTNGASWSEQESTGGAIENAAGASLNVRDVSFDDDTAIRGGGAIDNHGTAAVSDSTFADDSSQSADGAAIDNADGTSGTLVASDSTFKGSYVPAQSTLPKADATVVSNGANGGSGSEAMIADTLISPQVGDLLSLSGGSTTIAGDLFIGPCSVAPTATLVNDGYNASSGSTCAKKDATDRVSTTVDAFASIPIGYDWAVGMPPTTANAAVNLIPTSAQPVSLPGGGSFALCPTTDEMGNAGPTAGARCSAGAMQVSYSPPSQPLDLSVASDGAISWTASQEDGGSPITSYTLKYSDAKGPSGSYLASPTQTVGEPGYCGDGPTFTCQLGLSTGHTYMLTLTAKNYVGLSSASVTLGATIGDAANEHETKAVSAKVENTEITLEADELCTAPDASIALAAVSKPKQHVRATEWRLASTRLKIDGQSKKFGHRVATTVTAIVAGDSRHVATGVFVFHKTVSHGRQHRVLTRQRTVATTLPAC